MTILVAVLLAASIAGSLYLVLAAIAVRQFAKRAASAAGPPMKITVLKPLRGEDPELYDNLRSFCDQDHPAYQVVFAVRDAEDAAVPVVRRLIADLPDRDLSLVIDARTGGSNLKVANLENMLASAKHQILVIADSDMRVRRDYLTIVTAPLAEDEVGLVTCLYRGRPMAGFAAQLGALWVNHAFLPSAIVAERVRPGDACFGATMALRSATLEAIGGFARLRDHLADDYALGAAVRGLGKRIELSPLLVDTIVADASIRALIGHELRWMRTIRSIAPLGFAASFITHPLALATLATIAAGFTLPTLTAIVAILGCRLATIRLAERALDLPRAPAWLVPIRDLLSFAVFAVSFCGNTVAWRDRKFRIDAEGRLVANGDTGA
jgi:ceramide glucosyltransferase